MPKRSRTASRPDTNQIAHAVVARATGERKRTQKNPAAVALGRLGGAKGGPARAKSLSPAERSEIAKKAAKTRWKNHKPAE
jgi:hypothetical protein